MLWLVSMVIFSGIGILAILWFLLRKEPEVLQEIFEQDLAYEPEPDEGI